MAALESARYGCPCRSLAKRGPTSLQRVANARIVHSPLLTSRPTPPTRQCRQHFNLFLMSDAQCRHHQSTSRACPAASILVPRGFPTTWDSWDTALSRIPFSSPALISGQPRHGSRISPGLVAVAFLMASNARATPRLSYRPGWWLSLTARNILPICEFSIFGHAVEPPVATPPPAESPFPSPVPITPRWDKLAIG